MSKRRVWGWTLGALPALIYVACTENFVVDDPSFDLWCGKKLCAWDIDAGEIRKVSTWHERDYAVKLVGTPAQISQRAPTSDAPCLRFELIANAEAGALAKVQVDFDDDGSIEEEHAIPTQKWAPAEFLIRTPSAYDGVRFIVRKEGKGSAVVAQVGVQEDADCDGTAQPTPRCADDSDCDGNAVCLSGTCSRCAGEGACGAGQACERDDHCDVGVCTSDVTVESAPFFFSRVCSLCAADATCGDGESCSDDAHCEGSLPCVQGRCSRCAAEGDCAQGERCEVDADCRVGGCRGGVCGECVQDTDCSADDVCMNGFCGECRDDSDCSEITRCAFRDGYSARGRVCREGDSLEERMFGQLCSSDAQCPDALTCGALHDDLPPRCGVACQAAGEDCGDGRRCREVLTGVDADANLIMGFVCADAEQCEDALLGCSEL